MIDSLTQLFSKYKQVRRAFIASIRERADEQPNLLIGIEAESDIEAIIQAAGSVATDTLPDDAPIDICEVVADEKGISHFFYRPHHAFFMNVAGAVFCATSKAARALSESGAA
ncbi:enhanced serine sensitivity protein SseB C-terminal domain-containing protein [Pantoea tagorei]